jgi:hypothetical protein
MGTGLATKLTYFFVNRDMNLDTLLSLSFQETIDAPFWKICRRTSKI